MGLIALLCKKLWEWLGYTNIKGYIKDKFDFTYTVPGIITNYPNIRTLQTLVINVTGLATKYNDNVLVPV